MKKLLFIVSLIIIGFVVNAQTHLYKGINSGISEMDFRLHCLDNSDFEKVYDPGSNINFYRTKYLGAEYIMWGEFDRYGKLYSLHFVSTYKCEKYDGWFKLKSISDELVKELRIRWCYPSHNQWPLEPWIVPKNDLYMVGAFEPQSLKIFVWVENRAERGRTDKFNIYWAIHDTKIKPLN